MKKIITIVIGLFLLLLGLFGIFHENSKVAHDYINVEGKLQFAKMWWGAYDSVPKWVRGPSRVRIEVTPHLWLKLQTDPALFLLATAGNTDKELSQILHPGDPVKIYFHYEKQDGAYPVKQIEKNGKIIFSHNTIKKENRWMGIAISALGLIVLAFGLKKRKNGPA